MAVILPYLPVFGSLWFSPITYLEMIYKCKGAKGYKKRKHLNILEHNTTKWYIGITLVVKS